MSITATTPTPFTTRLDIPAWIEVDRLRAKRHFLTLHSPFRVACGDREREERRKKRQWQRWKSALDAALDSVRRQAIVTPDICMPRTIDTFQGRPSIRAIDSVPSDTTIRFPFLKNQTFRFIFRECHAGSWPRHQGDNFMSGACAIHAKRLLDRRSLSERAKIRRRLLWARRGFQGVATTL